MAKLGDIFTLVRNGANIKQEKGKSGIPITRIETISTKQVDRSKLGYADVFDIHQYENYILQDRDILMSHINSISHLGKSAIYHREEDEVIIHGVNLLCLRANADILCPQYAYYYFDSAHFRKQILAITKPSVNQASFTVAELKKIEIPLPDLATQRRIAATLDKVTEGIAICKQMLSDLEALVKSRFVEMFGDPFDTARWTVMELNDVSESLVDGSNIDTDYYESQGNVLFLRIQNVWRNEFRLEDSVFISQEINRKYYYDTSLKTGDLLITKIGRYYTKDSSLGRVSVYRGANDGANYSNNIMRVRLKSIVNSEYVNVLLNLDDYQAYIRHTSKGGTDKRALSKSLIGSYPIILPPKKLQDELAAFVKQVDKSKSVVQQQLLELETLKKQLIQKYFR